LEEITVEKIKKRIIQNLDPNVNQASDPNVNQVSDSNSRSSYSVLTLREKLIAFGLRHKYIILKIPLLNKIARKIYSLAKRSSSIRQMLKRLIRKIPLLGFLAWWIYKLVKTPSNIVEILKKIDSQKEETRNLGKFVQRTEEKTQAISKEVDNQKEEIRNLAQLNPQIDLKDVYVSYGSLGVKSYLSRAFENGIIPVNITADKTNEDVFYYALENLFRGELAEIEKKQSIYLPYITEANNRSKGACFLDLGCGRGEFLDLLTKHNVAVKGIDVNQFTVDILKRQGLDASRSDALDYLAGLNENTLKGITAFQVIEHLNYEYIKSLLAMAFNKIASDGIIILESVNPYCMIGLGEFYIDPTHIKPLSPDLMKFLLEWYGFSDVQIVYSNSIPKSLRNNHIIMNYRTYAVIGKKLTNEQK
jgi:O-antigen chain-terminating methyltransferase